MTISTKAYAKINLHLDVTGRLPNGYHTIRSIMQTVSLYDIITVTRDTASDGTKDIRITCTDPTIPTDKRNIVHKCAVAFFEHFSIDAYSILIHIDKRIPHAAGLAGGSTDGAAVLKLLPQLFEVSTDTAVLCDIGGQVGADIPFCIVGSTCLAEGIGEKLTPLKREFTCPVLIAIGGEGVSTPEAYGRIDSQFGDRFGKSNDDDGFADFLASPRIPERLYNIFEEVILPTHEEACSIKENMLAYGAKASLMSGSGPSVFGLFESEDRLETALRFFTKEGIRAYPCGFVN